MGELMEQQTLNLEKLNGEKQLNYQKVLPQRDYLVTVPTELGLPVVISVKMPVVLSLRGKIQSQIQPSRITPSTLLKKQQPIKIEVNAEIKPLISVQRLTTSSIVTPFIQEELVAGVEQHAEIALPGKLYFKLDTSSKKVEIDFQPSQQPSEVVVAYHHIRPFTTIYNPIQMRSMTLAPEFKVIQKPVQPWHKSVEFGKKYLGLDLIAELKTEAPVVGFAKIYETLKHHTPLTALNFFYALPRPVCNQKMMLVFKPSNSETKSIKMLYQYKSHMMPNLNTVAEEYYDNVRPSRPIFANMWQVTEQQKSLSGLPLPRKFQTVSYNGAVNHTIYANLRLEGSNPRIYEAMASIVNYTTPQVYTVNVTMGFRIEQVPEMSPAGYYVESVLQVPTIKEHRLQELINKPVYAVASTNITVPEHKMIQVRVKMVRDEQQKRFAEMSPESKRCQQNEQQGWLYSQNCTDAKLQATTLNNVTVEIKRVGTPISNTAYKMLYKIDSIVKYLLFPHMETEPVLKSEKPPEVEMYLRRDPFRQIWDVEAKKPYEVTRFHNVTEKKMPLTSILPLDLFMSPKAIMAKKLIPSLLPFTMHHAPEPIVSKDYILEQVYPSCVAQQTFLKTFDNVTVSLREASPNCWHLLAKDCSEEARFAVFVKPSSSGKEAKIVLGKTEIRIVPSSEQPQININGKQVSLTEETLNHPVFEHENGYPVVLAKRLPSKKVEIYSPLYQVKVYHDGQNVIVEPFRAYRGRMCGLCGDLNGERMADLKTPELCALNTTKTKEFFSSWIVPEGSCQPQQVPKKECFRPHYIPTGEIASEIAPATLRGIWSETPYEMRHIEITHHGRDVNLFILSKCASMDTSHLPMSLKRLSSAAAPTACIHSTPEWTSGST